MKKIIFAALAVFLLCGAAGLADMFGMADVSGLLRKSSEQFKAEYRAEQSGGTLTETTVITKETAVAE